MATQGGDIADLANSVNPDYSYNALVDIATTLRDYPAVEKLMEKKRMKPFSGTSTEVKVGLLYQGDNNTRATGLYDQDNLDQQNGTVYATVPYRHITTGNHFDRRELSMNSSPSRIFDFVKSKQFQMWIDWFETMEGYFWGGPSSSTDTTTPWGLTKYWLDHDATTGQNGGNHTNFSSGPGGVDCTDSNYSGFKHFTAQHTNVSMEDAVQKMRHLMYLSRYRGIPNRIMKDFAARGKYNLGIYTHLDNVMDLEDIATSLDDKIGRDLAKYDNEVMIRRVPVEEVPWITANRDTSKPFFGIDWDVVVTIYPKNEWVVRTPYHRSPTAHNVRQEFVDCSRNFVVLNRRRLWSVATAAYVSS